MDIKITKELHNDPYLRRIWSREPYEVREYKPTINIGG